MKAPSEASTITAGPLAPGMIRFAWPLTIAMATNAINVMADMYWVGGLGVASVAAVLNSSILTMLAFSLQLGAQTGAGAFISRAFGANDIDGARAAAGQGLMLSVAMGLIVGVTYGFGAEWFFATALGQSDEVTALGAAYLRPLGLGMTLAFLQSQCATILQAIGEARKTTAIFLSSALINIVLDPVLIYGWVGPALGVTGAALATVISRSVGMVIGMLLIAYSGGAARTLGLRLRPVMPGALFVAMMKVGAPRFIQFSFVPLSQMLLLKMAVILVSETDANAVSAAFTVCLRLEFIILLPIFGLSRASQVFIGQNLGADQVARARRSGWVAVSLSALYLMVASGLYLSNPGAVIEPFLTMRRAHASAAVESAEELKETAGERETRKVVEYGTEYVRTVGWVFVCWGVVLILNASISGAGDTVFPAIATGLLLLPGRVGMAWGLSRWYGLQGIWLAVAASMVIGALVYVSYYQHGRWVRIAAQRVGRKPKKL